MSKILIKNILEVWTKYFGNNPKLIRSPGRINLIGEHTDYNDGYVFPAAINRYIILALQPSSEEISKVMALDPGEEMEFDVHGRDLKYDRGAWQNYVFGVVREIQKAGYDLENFNMIFSGNIPAGAGLSSSAALENAIVFGLNEIFELNIPRTEMILISQRSEHNYAGVECGIMDQYASMFGEAGSALLLDCRSIRSLTRPLHLHGYELLLINSNVHHSLAESSYNERRAECESGMDIIRDFLPEAKALRDVSLPQLESIVEHFPPLIYDRCTYVIKENARVLQSLLVLEEGDMQNFGAILSEAHNDMRYLYEITCPEIDFLIDILNEHPAVLGCRMTGGGFGGCILCLAEQGRSGDVISDQLRTAYNKRFSRQLDLIDIKTSDGTSVIQG